MPPYTAPPAAEPSYSPRPHTTKTPPPPKTTSFYSTLSQKILHPTPTTIAIMASVAAAIVLLIALLVWCCVRRSRAKRARHAKGKYAAMSEAHLPLVSAAAAPGYVYAPGAPVPVYVPYAVKGKSKRMSVP